MLLGIVTDIHDKVDNLVHALSKFRHAGVERVICLGDAFNTFRPGEAGAEVCRLLSSVDAIGVWGNHDAGVSLLPSEHIIKYSDSRVLTYAATLQGQLILGDAHFTHVEPWLNPKKLEDLWYSDGPPDTIEKAQRSFDAVPERYLFMGHFHRWLVMTPRQRVEWKAEGSLFLKASHQYLIVVAAVFNGWCALFDTEARELIPVRCLA